MMRAWLEQQFLKAWYGSSRWSYALLPLEALYTFIATRRKQEATRLAVPVVVVGNIVVGGSGKTPLTLALVDLLLAQGFKPGVVSRGYGGQCSEHPHIVTVSDSAAFVGDEPKLMAARALAPVCIDPQRVRGSQALIAAGCDIILCDDGLQHQALARDIEIAVFDAKRLAGNGHCLPVGPLREPLQRLQSVDFVMLNGDLSSAAVDSAKHALQLQAGAKLPAAMAEPLCSSFVLQANSFVQVGSNKRLSCAEFVANYGQQPIAAISGIGNPQRFFDDLLQLGLDLKVQQAMPDHHAFSENDIAVFDGSTLVMTEKDAVKCLAFAKENVWIMQVDVALADDFTQQFLTALKKQITLKTNSNI